MTALPRLLLALLLLAALPAAAAEFFALNTGDLRAELADAKRDGKRGLMLFFEQEGCPGCAHMKENVLPLKSVQDYYGRHFLSLSVDIFGAVPLRDASGREWTEKTFAQSVNIRATPTFLFYDLSGREVVRIVGPLRTAGEFLLLGEYVASGAYKTRTFARFKLDHDARKGG